jgi:hypothetical protein
MRIQPEILMCFEENDDHGNLFTKSLTELNDGENLSCVSLRWRSPFTQHLLENPRKYFYRSWLEGTSGK